MTDEVKINELPVAIAAGTEDLLLIWQDGEARVIPVSKFREKLDGTLPELTDDWNAGPFEIRAKGLRPQDGGTSIELTDDGGNGIRIENGIITLPGVTEFNLAGATIPGLNLDQLQPVNKPSIGSATQITTQAAHGFANGNPVRWDGSKWAKAGARGKFPPIDDWAGIVKVVDANTFTLHQLGQVSGLSGFLANKMFYWNAAGTGWTTTAPTDTEIIQGAFQGKVYATSTTEVIVLPSRRRHMGFRLMASLPTGAGRVSKIVSTNLSPTGAMLCGTAQQGSNTAALYKSMDGGITWTKAVDAPSPFNAVTNLIAAPVRTGSLTTSPITPMITVFWGFTADQTTVSDKRWMQLATSTDITDLALTSPGSAWGPFAYNVLASTVVNGYIVAFCRNDPAKSAYNIYSARSAGYTSQGTSGQLGSTKGPVAIANTSGNDYYIIADDTTVIYKATQGALAPTLDYVRVGTTSPFVKTGGGNETFRDIAINGKTMLIATASGRIFRSPDYTLDPAVYSAATIPNTPTINDMLYVGNAWYAAANDGVYWSSDDGVTWIKIHDNAGTAVTALAADANFVYAGTADGKILVRGVTK